MLLAVLLDKLLIPVLTLDPPPISSASGDSPGIPGLESWAGSSG